MGRGSRGNLLLSGHGHQAFRIIEDPVTGPEIADLIAFHLAELNGNSPPESVHALGLQALRAPQVTLWSAWEGQQLLGCGALKQIDPQHGEIKSMRTHPSHLRRGVAALLLEHMIREAARRGYARLSLETGTGPAFAAAHELYSRFGFRPCAAFGDYADTAFNRFMMLAIDR